VTVVQQMSQFRSAALAHWNETRREVGEAEYKVGTAMEFTLAEAERIDLAKKSVAEMLSVSSPR